jgi:hypothetical protein
MPTPYTVATHLKAALTDPTKSIPFYKGDLYRGAAYHLFPDLSNRRNNQDRWFSQHPALPSWNVTIGNKFKGKPAVLLNWPNFLRQAQLPATSFGHVAHEILEMLEPLVLQFDAVLHTDLMSLRKNYRAKDQAYRAEHPGFLGGSLDPLEWDRFNSHLERFCTNASAMRLVRLSLEATWHLSRYAKERAELNLPDNTSILNPRFLGDNRRSRRELTLPQNLLKMTQPWSRLVHYLASGFAGSDGVWFYPARGSKGAAVLVNWDRLIEIAKHQKYDDSPLVRLLAFTSPTAGFEAKQAFSKATNGRLVYERSDMPLSDYVIPTGLPVPTGLSHGWDVYGAAILSSSLQSFNKNDEGLRRARMFRKRMPGAGEAPPKRFKVVYADYGDKGICIIKRGGNLLFTLPYTPDDLFTLPEYRSKTSIRMGSDIYWTDQAINLHANGKLTGATQVAPEPEARLFLPWVAQQKARLYGKDFNKALYEQARPQRIGEYARGDRKTLGLFTEFEDAELNKIFMAAPAGPLDSIAKEYLRRTLPGRSDTAINRRREHHGFQYALQHGWLKYCSSGYCGSRSQKRKARWLKAGVVL